MHRERSPHRPECCGTKLDSRGGIKARGGHGPDLLPGTRGVFISAAMRAVACKGCRLVRFHASTDALERVTRGRGWKPM